MVPGLVIGFINFQYWIMALIDLEIRQRITRIISILEQRIIPTMKYYEISTKLIIRYPLIYLYAKHNNNARVFNQILQTLSLSTSFRKETLEEVNISDGRYNGLGFENVEAVVLDPYDLWVAAENAVIIDPTDDVEKPFSDLGDTMFLVYKLIQDALDYEVSHPDSDVGIFNILDLGIYAPIALLDATVPDGLPDREIFDEGGNVTGYHTFRTWGGSWKEGQNPDTSPSGKVLYNVYTPSRQGALNMSEIVVLYESALPSVEVLYSVDKLLKLETEEFNYDA